MCKGQFDFSLPVILRNAEISNMNQQHLPFNQSSWVSHAPEGEHIPALEPGQDYSADPQEDGQHLAYEIGQDYSADNHLEKGNSVFIN